jgi:hypothetical protein
MAAVAVCCACVDLGVFGFCSLIPNAGWNSLTFACDRPEEKVQ